MSISELVEHICGFLLRRYMTFAIVTGLATGCGLVYLLTAPAEYTAHAVLMIDTSKLRALQPSLADVPLDTAQVESQVELLKSDTVGKAVVKDLHLMDDPEFARAGLWSTLFSAPFWLFGGDNAARPRTVRKAGAWRSLSKASFASGPSPVSGGPTHSTSPLPRCVRRGRPDSQRNH